MTAPRGSSERQGGAANFASADLSPSHDLEKIQETLQAIKSKRSPQTEKQVLVYAGGLWGEVWSSYPCKVCTVFVDDQGLIMMDSVSISIMTHLFPWLPAALSFTNNISAGFLDRGRGIQKKDSLKTNWYVQY